MKKFINDPFDFVEELTEGIIHAHPDVYKRQAWDACEKGFNKAIAELGWEGHFLAPQEANDLSEMVTLTETALTNGADIILGAFNDANMFSDVIARCTEAGVPVIGLWGAPDGVDCKMCIRDRRIALTTARWRASGAS